jgi:subtilisin family serine protease
MKKNIFIVLFCLSLFSDVTAQSKINFTLLKEVRENKQNQNQLVDIFVQGDIKVIKTLVNEMGGMFKYSANNIAAIKIPLQKISGLITNKAIQRIEAYPQHIQPLNDTMLANNNVLPIHHGQSPLTQIYDGTGVVIGIIDTGIDFSHPDFKDSTGKSRIKFLWDQAKPMAANTPQTYNYGQEWNNFQIDSGLAAAHSDVSGHGHGTHVSGIAVGNGLSDSGHYKGVAPKCDIVFVALNFNSSSSALISDAVDYIFAKAQMMGKPCVINASIGDIYGSHDGQDLQAQLIGGLIDLRGGQVLVAAGGNSGNVPFHLGYTVTSDTNFTMFKYNSSYGAVYTQQMWADTSNFKHVHFAIGADQMSPVHSFRGRTPFSTITSRLGVIHKDTLYNNGHRIGIVQSYGDIYNRTYSMEFYIVPDSINYDWRLITTGTGKFDLWSLDMLSTNIPSAATMPDSSKYKSPDLDQTMESSFQCLDNVITVGNYTNRRSYIDFNHNLYLDTTKVPGKLHITSGVGPTRDGRIKPDIAAPGDQTLSCAVLSMVPNITPTAITKDGFHIRGGGTSAASPGVAGIAALYLQKNPNATAIDVKNAITGCARHDQFTGNNLPNRYWGYGKANAFGALTGCASTGIENENEKDNTLLIYPNPSSSGTVINVDVSIYKPNDKAELRIYNALGELVKTVAVSSSTIQLNNTFKPGIYFCDFILNGKNVITKKLTVL